MKDKLDELIEKYMPKRYYGHEARKYAKIIAEIYAKEYDRSNKGQDS